MTTIARTHPDRPGNGALPQPEAPPAFDPGPLDDLLEAIGDAGPELVGRLVTAFVAEAPGRLARAAEAAAAGRTGELQRVAHSLTSGSAALGALRLSARCRDLETRARAGESDLGPLVATATAAFDQARPHLEAEVGFAGA